jgi:hypothetical protein
MSSPRLLVVAELALLLLGLRRVGRSMPSESADRPARPFAAKMHGIRSLVNFQAVVSRRSAVWQAIMLRRAAVLQMDVLRRTRRHRSSAAGSSASDPTEASS